MRYVFGEIFGLFWLTPKTPERPKNDKNCKIFPVLTFLCNFGVEFSIDLLTENVENVQQGKKSLSGRL